MHVLQMNVVCQWKRSNSWRARSRLFTAVISGSDVARLCSSLSLASCPYPSPWTPPSLMHNLYCTSADSLAMSHKAWHVGLSYATNEQTTICNDSQKESNSPGMWLSETCCCSHTGHAVSWGLKGENGEEGERTGHCVTQSTPLALPEKAWLGCECVWEISPV